MSKQGGRVALVLLVVQAGIVIALTNVLLYIDAVESLPQPVSATSLIGAFQQAFAQRPTQLLYLVAIPVSATLMVALAVALRRQRPSVAAVPTGPQAPLAPSDDSALRLLAILQSEGRFIDFLEESIDPYSDEQVGAAVRSIHEGCRQALHQRITIERIYREEEGTEIEIPTGFDPSSVRLTGNVEGSPPFRGILQHAGWRVGEVNLPPKSEAVDINVLAPAEVEIS